MLKSQLIFLKLHISSNSDRNYQANSPQLSVTAQIRNIHGSYPSSRLGARIQIHFPLEPILAKDLETGNMFKGSFESNLSLAEPFGYTGEVGEKKALSQWYLKIVPFG